MRKKLLSVVVLALAASTLHAQETNPCRDLPSREALQTALRRVVSARSSGGLGFNMWLTTVNRDGVVCQVVFTGNNRGDQWPGSRVISAQKANTANAFSLPNFALSTANLYAAVQPGRGLFGLQESNPVNPTVAYDGDPAAYGQTNDPMVGKRIGGINVFGGGLALYRADGTLLGALGVSGDTSCTDHVVAWKVRDALGLDFVPAGVAGGGRDNIILDAVADPATGNIISPSGFGHPACPGVNPTVANSLVETSPVGPNQ